MAAMDRIIFTCLLICLLQNVQAYQISPAAAPLQEGNCPLNVSYLSSHPWIVQKCKEGTHCCEALVDLMRIMLFSWMHHTNSFLLTDIDTSRVCVEAIQRQMESQGVAADNNVFQGCKMQPSDFVNAPRHCHRIQNRSAFEIFVNASEIKSSCDGSRGRFHCHTCIRAMVEVLRQLMEKDGTEKNNCELFVIVYVGGGINAYEELGPDAAYCILSAQNLPEMADMVEGSKPGETRGRKAGRSKITEAAIGLGVLIPAAAILIFFGVYIAARRKICGVGFERLVLSRRGSQLLRESIDLTTGLLYFRYSDLKDSTGNFAATNVIGEGGFGTVFRGTLPDGYQIAVKRFNDSTTKGDVEFRHEVHVISSVKHRNLLPLKGYCIHAKSDGHQHFLVYDYMPNGSLSDYLFRRGGNESKPVLTWPQRRRIAVGIARGLAYLHGDAKPAIIHRDVKAANVLLDADLNALVADFGLARFKEEDPHKTHYTTRAVGTLGYVAPEYGLYGHLTDKSDVYSFGILVLELMSGRRALDMSDAENMVIAEWAYELAQKGRAEEVIDERLREEEEGHGGGGGGGENETMEKVVLLALQCAHARAAGRPSIQQALSVLESIDRPGHRPPLPDVISFSSNASGSGNGSAIASSGSKLAAWDWVVSAEESYGSGSVAVSGVSTESYQTGR